MVAEETLQDKIVEQIEYYFGDVNLPRDKFLQEQIKLDEGWVTLDTLLKFNRLARLSTDKVVIADAIKAANSELIVLSEDGTKVRRNPERPLPENSLEYWQSIKSLTVYMKGFKQDTTLDDIRDWAKQYGRLKNVIMRQTKPDKLFKGSVFITFETQEEAEKAQKDSSKFGDVELTRMMQNDYWQKKNRETKEKRAAEKAMKSGKNAKTNADSKDAAHEVSFTKGLVLEVSGVPKETKYQDLKDFFKTFGEIGYVVFNDDTETTVKAQIRFSGKKEDGAKHAWEAAVAAAEDGKVKFKDQELTSKVLEGDEEAAYWEVFNQSRQNKFKRSKQSKRGGRIGGRGRKRPAGPHEDLPKGKRTVFAEDD